MQLIGKNTRVAVIANSRDATADLQKRPDRLGREIEGLKSINLSGTELDLREYVGHTEELRKEIKQYGAVWVLGGNAFVLRRIMRDSGFDEIIKDMLAKDEIVYAGYSAAGCVMGSTLRGLEMVDAPSDVTDILKEEIIWDGLGILPYSLIPHYKSDHPESAAIDETVEFLKKEHIPFRTIQDGEVLVVEGDREEVLR